MALLTLPELKAELGITTTDRDARLTRLVSAVSQAVKDYLNFDPESVGDTVTLNPNAGSTVTIPKIAPSSVVTIVDVWESCADPPVFDSDTVLEVDIDYRQQAYGSASLIRLNTNWPTEVRRETDRLAGNLNPDVGSVQVEYTIVQPGALLAAQEAALAEAMFRVNFNAGQWIGVYTSETVDGLSETLNTSLLPQQKTSSGMLLCPGAVLLLKGYRDIGAFIAVNKG